MTSLIIIFLLIISIQRAVAFVFADFPYFSILLQQIFGVLMPVWLYFEFIKKEKYIEKKDLKIKLFDIPIAILAGFFTQFFGSFINYPVIIILSELNIKAPEMESVPQGGKLFAYIFLICVLPAVFEEVLFRKLTFSTLSKYGKIKALIITAFIFGIIHFNPYSLIPLILAGFMLTYMVYKGFSLIYTVIFHFSINFSGIILDFITRSEKANEIINNYFPLFGLLSGFSILAFILYIRKQSEE